MRGIIEMNITLYYIEFTAGVLKRNKLRWFGHVKRKEDVVEVRKCMHNCIWRLKVQSQVGDQDRPGWKWLRMIYQVLDPHSGT